MEALLSCMPLDGSEALQQACTLLSCLLLSLLVGSILSPLRSFFPIVAKEDKTCQCRPVSYRDLLLLKAQG